MIPGISPESRYEDANSKRTLELIRAAESERIARLGTGHPYGQQLGFTLNEARGAYLAGYVLKIVFSIFVIISTVELFRRLFRR